MCQKHKPMQQTRAEPNPSNEGALPCLHSTSRVSTVIALHSDRQTDRQTERHTDIQPAKLLPRRFEGGIIN